MSKLYLSWAYLILLFLGAIVADFIFIKDPWTPIAGVFIVAGLVSGVLLFMAAVVTVIEHSGEKKNRHDLCDDADCQICGTYLDDYDGMRTK